MNQSDTTFYEVNTRLEILYFILLLAPDRRSSQRDVPGLSFRIQIHFVERRVFLLIRHIDLRPVVDLVVRKRDIVGKDSVG
jgi:hypothetical protein